MERGWKSNSKRIWKVYFHNFVNLWKLYYIRNYKIGKELNCWKGGVLVADDEGKVLKKIEETENK